MKTYANPVYAYHRSPDQDNPPQRRPVIVVGAGPSASRRRSTLRCTTFPWSCSTTTTR
jgi:hypothetical protein